MLFSKHSYSVTTRMVRIHRKMHVPIRPTNVIQFLMCCSPFEGRWPDQFLLVQASALKLPGSPSLSDGDEGTRTPDLLLAKEALSRLSYIPRP